MNIVLFGSEGMLGKRIAKAFSIPEENCFGVEYKDNGERKKINITNPGHVFDVINSLKPELVINAAAYTDVDCAENNKTLADAVNRHGVENIVGACKAYNSRLLYFSTDYVFSGNSQVGYTEEDKTGPLESLNIYGQTKLLGEEVLVNSGLGYYLVRTSWMFAEEKGFVKTIRSRACVHNELEVVADETGCPTYAKDLAEALVELVNNYKPGIYHITNSGFCSRYELAKYIVENSGFNCRIIPTTQEKYREKYGKERRIARRPALSVLINTRFKELRPWQEAVAGCLQKMELVEGFGEAIGEE